jgi:polyisoprenyl-teichoic acid--peptidoglycan teichoic acid transferase
MKKKLLFILIPIVVIIAAIGGYGFYLWNSVQTAATKMHVNVKLKNHTPPKLTSSTPQPISILLLGVDERTNDVGRSDSTMVLTANPEKQKMQIVSIPRDTQVTIPGRGVHKINAAYAYGGPALAMQTIENFTGIKLDYYVRINMEALSALVDAVGGVTVYNTIDWKDEGYYKKGFHYTKGNLTLNGPEALGFVRMRHEDPNGDFGRNQRQREVMTAIVNKAAKIQSIGSYTKILAALGNNVKTNMTFNDMKNIVTNYRDIRNNVQEYEVQGTGSTQGGVYFFHVSDQEKQKVSNMLKDNLSKG